MGIINLKSAPQRSHAREALSAAIANHAEARTYLDGLNNSLAYDGAASTAVRTARKALQAAEEALVEARADTVIRMGGVVQPNTAPVLSIREARANIADAEEMLDAARIARSETEAAVAQGEKNLGSRQRVLRDRAIDVLKDEVGPKAASYFAELNQLKSALEFLAGETNWLVTAQVFSRTGHDPQYDADRRAGGAKWDSGLSALMADPDAPAAA